jgi:glycosyltransferase involved in cell wall biosynthesis
VISSRILDASKSEEINGVKVFRQDVIYLPQIPYVIPIRSDLLNKIIKIYEIDVIHAHTVEFVSSYFAFKEARKLKKPFVVSLHGMKRTTGRIFVDIVSNILDYTISRKIVKSADAVVALSDELKRRAVSLGAPLERIRVIPNGVDIEDLTSAKGLSRKCLSLSNEDFIVGFVGRLYPIKGISYLIEAGKSLISQIPNLKVVIVGDGPLKEALIEKTESARDRFVFTGYVEDARQLFPLFDICVLPSLSEGLSTTMLESLSYGIPVISTNVGAAKDIIQNGFNGILVPTKDSKAISESIRHLYEDKKMRAWMGVNAKKAIIDSYGWDKIIPKLEKLYQELLN